MRGNKDSHSQKWKANVVIPLLFSITFSAVLAGSDTDDPIVFLKKNV